MEEIWKDIPGHNAQVSNLGRIRYFRYGNFAEHKHKYQKYFVANIHGKSFYLHRLIAEQFIPNPKNLPSINHINMDKTDNRAENLEWCSPADNISKARSIKVWGQKEVDCYDKQNKYMASFPSGLEAARKLGIGRGLVYYSIATGNCVGYKQGGFKFKYKQQI